MNGKRRGGRKDFPSGAVKMDSESFINNLAIASGLLSRRDAERQSNPVGFRWIGR